LISARREKCKARAIGQLTAGLLPDLTLGLLSALGPHCLYAHALGCTVANPMLGFLLWPAGQAAAWAACGCLALLG